MSSGISRKKFWPFCRRRPRVSIKPSKRSRPLIWAAACASFGKGGVIVSQNRTNKASVSAVRPTSRSRRWTWRDSRSRRRANAASRRSSPSGDRNEATAASTIADRESFLRSARSAICFRSSGGKYTFIRSRMVSQLHAIIRVERDLAGDTTHLLAQNAGLTGGIVRLVVEYNGKLLRRPRGGRLLGDRDMVGKLGFAAQAAVGGILFRPLDFYRQYRIRRLRLQHRPSVHP